MQRTTEALQNMDEKENMRRMSNTESGNFLMFLKTCLICFLGKLLRTKTVKALKSGANTFNERRQTVRNRRYDKV